MGPAGAALLALVAAADPESVRTAVDVGISTEGRSRSVDVVDRPPVLTSELELLPLARLEIASRRTGATFAYGPRLVADGLDPRVVHEGRAQLEWRPDRTWSLRLAGDGSYGREPRPGSRLQSDPEFAIEVSPLEIVEYVRWAAGASLELRPTRRWRIQASAGWQASGGLGEAEASMPREEGPRARASAAWSATRRDVFGGALDASATSIAGAPDVRLASGEVSWRRMVARDLEAELAAGAGGARSTDGKLGSVRPMGRAGVRATWPGAVARAELAGVLETTIVVDRYTGLVQNRHEVRATAGWAGLGGWRFDGRLAGALLADGRDVQNRVGAAELRAAMRVARGASVTSGVRFTWQQSVVATISSFTEWSAFVGVALLDHRVVGERPPESDAGPAPR